MSQQYECIVIGGGHAGIEAALATSRMGCSTLMVNFFSFTIGQMSCNPAIGGVGKGQIVKEIDCLGGEMGLAADRTGIQFRQLNSSKGPAVRSSRCQSDKKRYRWYMHDVIRRQKNLTVLEAEVCELCVEQGRITGVVTAQHGRIRCRSVVVTAGTFLRGRIHIGPTITSGGRIGEPSAVRLTDNIRDLGFEVMFFKTGTPPRLDGKTIDFSRMEPQHSDPRPIPFSFRTPCIPATQPLLPCYITHTTKRTHEIITENMHLSPMYSGQIQATGVRYCPSIEDKLKKFADKESHHVFLEPQGSDTDIYYPNGVSTGLPADVQEMFIHAIPGLEAVRIVRPGYSIEHGVIPPTSLKASLETKAIAGLFLAGQINGSTGYEEAAGQGMVAGINAGLSVQGKPPFILGRDESYIGVLIDDLVTKGTNEPYRMFTSRVEYRLLVREDNADQRLMGYGHAFGLISDDVFAAMQKKYETIDRELTRLRTTRVTPGGTIDTALVASGNAPLRQPCALSDILKRPEIDHAFLGDGDPAYAQLPDEIIEQVEYAIKYEGFIARQCKDVERFRHIENIKIPGDMNYDDVHSLSIEIRQKLKAAAPRNLGQAHRISGVTPAAISILMIYLKKKSLERRT